MNMLTLILASITLSLEPGGYDGIFTPDETPSLTLKAANGGAAAQTVQVAFRTYDYFGNLVSTARETLELNAGAKIERRLDYAALKPTGFFVTVADWSCGAEKGTAEGSFVKVGAVPAKPDRMFGINCYASDDAPLYERLGVGSKMVLFNWLELERKDGSLDFGKVRREIAALKAKGIAIEGVLSFVTPVYAPDRYLKPEFRDRKPRMDKAGDPILDQAKYYADIEAFVKTVAREFKDDVRTWSISGEINLLIRWAPHMRQRYVDTARIIAKALKAVDPNAVVQALGVSGGDGTENPRYRTVLSLLPEVVDVIDGLSIDQYTAGTHYGPGYVTKNTEESELREMMICAHGIAEKNGLKVLSIGEKGPAFDTALPILTPFGSEAGDMVARDYIILKTLPYVESWHYFRPKNWKVTHGGLDWGMWQDRNPRHTVSAYAATARLMNGAAFVKEIVVHKDMRCYAFRRDGRDFAAMWYNGQEPLAIRDAAVDSLHVADVEGNPVALANSTLTVSRSPIYVSGLSVERLEGLFAAAELNVPYIDAAFAVQAIGRSTLAVRNLTGKNLTATVVEFAAEPAFEWTKGEIALGPNETKRIELPCSPAKTRIVLKGSVGGSIVVADEFRPIALKRVAGWDDVARLEPIRLDDPERQTPQYVDLRANGVYTGVDDLSVEARFGYDDENFYVDCRVTDDVQLNDVQGAWLLWMADSVQMFFDARRDGAFDMLEGKKGEMPDDALVSIGDLKGWKCGYIHYGADLKGQRTRAHHLPVKPEIVRDEAKKLTHYRLKLPFACVAPLKPVKDQAFGFSFIVFDKDQPMQHFAYGISPNGASVGWNDPRFVPVFVFE